MIPDNPNVVLIDGHPASGKSLIRGALDGHPSGFVSPFHDLLPLAFCRKALDEDAMKAQDIEWLRQALTCRARYSRIERIARQREFPFEIAAGEIQQFDLGFDYAAFDERWVRTLLEHEGYWDPSVLVDHIYDAMRTYLQPELFALTSPRPQFYATLGDGDLDSSARFLDRFPNGKLIYMRRSPIEVFAALCSRSPKPGNYRTNHLNKYGQFKKYIQSGLLREIQIKNTKIERLTRSHPGRVQIIEFREFFSKFEEHIRRISHFIDIEDSASLYRFSFNGETVSFSNGQSVFCAPKDEPDELLSARQVAILDPTRSKHLTDRVYGTVARVFFGVRSWMSKMKSISRRLIH